MNRILSSFVVIYCALTISAIAHTTHPSHATAAVDYFRQAYSELKLKFEALHPGITSGNIVVDSGAVSMRKSGGDPSVSMRKSGGDPNIYMHDISVRLERLRADALRIQRKFPNDMDVKSFIALLDEFDFSWGMYQRGEGGAAARLSINFTKTDKLLNFGK